MPSKNDLSALKSGSKAATILPASPPSNDGEAIVKKGNRPLTKKPGRAGRPPKAPAEKRDYKITVSLTQAEGAKIKAKAGLAGEATYLYDLLLKAGAFK